MAHQPKAAKASRWSLTAPEGQGVTFVELFFDLVFVFALTQVTIMVAHDLTWSGVGHGVLVFWMIWWAWTQFTWALNPADILAAGNRSRVGIELAKGWPATA